eukprot:11175334-Lingulodinium_polyedra.AAC.1
MLCRSAFLRRTAVAALCQLAEKGNTRAIAAVSARLEHQQGGVREAAVEALGQVAQQGDKRAMAAVRARLTNMK